MVKLCFQMIVFNSDHVLGEALRSVLPFGPLVVTEGPCGYWKQQEHTTSTDQTNAILEEHEHYGQGILGVVRGQFVEKDAMVNASVKLVPDDTTHIFVVDADEVWRKQDLKRVIETLDYFNADSMSFIADSFFGGFDRIMTGFERDYKVTRIQRWYPGAWWATHRPPTIKDPQGRPYQLSTHIDAMAMLAMGVTMPHYSYTFPSQAVNKHLYYSHYQPGITIPNYPAEVFMPWVRGTDEERQEIEKRWKGVHNFIPSYRKESFTEPFVGKHPQEIENNREKLQQRIQEELAIYG